MEGRSSHKSEIPEDLIDRFKLDATYTLEYTLQISADNSLDQNAAGGNEKKWFRERELGSGGFGTVWLEVNRESGGEPARRALKEVRKSPMRKWGIDYKRELLAMAKLNKYSNNFVQFYGWFENVSAVFLIMEFFPYGDLGRYIADGFTEHETKQLARQLLGGLVIMHENGFAHRDLKPENIFVCSRSPIWRVKIGDFGIAKRVGDGRTALRTVIGTPLFQAPEISGFVDEDATEYTNAVDIWSLGCVLYNLLTQKVPFESKAAVRSFCSGKTRLSTQTLEAKHISKDCVNFIETLLIPDGSKRPTAQVALCSSWVRMPGVFLTETEREKGLRWIKSNGFDIDQDWSTAERALCLAAEKGKLLALLILLGKPVDVNAIEGYFGTALQAAAALGHDQVVELLLDEGADVHATGGCFGTALQAAARYGHDRIVQQLLEKGANVNTTGGKHGTALHAAAAGDYDEVVRLLLDKGADINAIEGKYGTALQAAAYGRCSQVVKVLLKKGAHVNTLGGYYGTALQAAAASGSDKIVQLLLEKKAKVNTAKGHYGTALQAAAASGSDGVVQLLLNQGADVNLVKGHYGTALQAAAASESERTVELLLKKGADVNVMKGYYGTALQAAAASGSNKITQLLLEKGAEINLAKGHYGTALQAAAAAGSYTIVQLLLERGANASMVTGRYRTALQAARFHGHDHIVKLLESASKSPQSHRSCVSSEMETSHASDELSKSLSEFDFGF